MPGEIDLKPQPPRDPLDPEILKRIDELIVAVAGHGQENHDLGREMVVTSLKSVRSGIPRGDMKLLNRSIRELRYAFKVLKATQHARKVTIFGSARERPGSPVYREAVSFGRKVRNRGWMVVTGAGPGVMQAGNQGAGKEHSVGINIRLPFEQEPNPYVKGASAYVSCRYFFTRKLLLAKEADAAAFFPGGFGTFDEAYELLTLIQTGKAEMIPIVLVDVPGGRFWRDWLGYVRRHLLRTGRISEPDLGLFKLCDDAGEAVEEVMRFYRNYHSMRYVGRNLVLRIHRPPDRRSLTELSRRFSDIVTHGGYSLTGALPEERDESAISELPRLVFQFDRHHFGRLRKLIDRLNDF